MPSPTEDFRKQVLALWSDPVKGLNPELANQFANRSIVMPVPAMGGTDAAPLDFSAGSANVFMNAIPIDTMAAEGTPVQYPCLQLYSGPSLQTYDGFRFVTEDVQFQGSVTLNVRFYLAWADGETPDDNDFETPLEAAESAFFACTNRTPSGFTGAVRYRNALNIVERMVPEQIRDGSLVRVGLRLSLTAKYIL